jgi:hypothetical protein
VTTSVSATAVIPTLGTSTTVSTTAKGGLLGAIASALAGKAGVHGGVLGATVSARGGVLGALAAKKTGTLPFTGLPVWVVALIGAGLVALGFGLRRQARATI